MVRLYKPRSYSPQINTVYRTPKRQTKETLINDSNPNCVSKKRTKIEIRVPVKKTQKCNEGKVVISQKNTDDEKKDEFVIPDYRDTKLSLYEEIKERTIETVMDMPLVDILDCLNKKIKNK
ncbi:hypothetical protein TCON_1826 [Astathelohania contejeani]|uniref:Uncharacterized protein n=1 Tax=Astathelohania contejeani TaxID=164912 RepID=A0ABQ7HXW7_9MICR|nr:hypothetical protein TCON_1826 [Thelohania contejeani]